VTEVAPRVDRLTIDRPQTNGRFVFRPLMHDEGEKVVVGHRIRRVVGRGMVSA